MVLSKNLLLLSALLLLLCGLVVGERGQSSQRRRTAIADRPSPAPSPSDDGDDDDDSSGKGGMPLKSDDGKGAKSYKSMKHLPTPEDENGKGANILKSSKSSKGNWFDTTMSMDMDMDINMDLPGKGAKSVKSSKSDKINNKLSKKDTKSKHGKLTAKPAMPPASPPSSISPSTPSPTSKDSISSKSSAYAITYLPSTNIPTAQDLQELTRMTQKYLEDYMVAFFDKTALTDLDNFLTIMVRDLFIEGEPVQVEYQSNGLFNPDSIFIPVTKEIDNLIQDAIGQEEYLDMVKSLSTFNPFRATESIALTYKVDGETTSESTGRSGSGENSSSFVRAGVAAAAAGVVVLAAGLAMLKSRRPSLDDDVDDDDIQSFSPQKSSSSEDSTIAGETCNMSVDDSSSHFAQWRSMKTYNNGTEEDEFEDEPLDSDDECEKMTPVASLS